LERHFKTRKLLTVTDVFLCPADKSATAAQTTGQDAYFDRLLDELWLAGRRVILDERGDVKDGAWWTLLTADMLGPDERTSRYVPEPIVVATGGDWKWNPGDPIWPPKDLETPDADAVLAGPARSRATISRGRRFRARGYVMPESAVKGPAMAGGAPHEREGLALALLHQLRASAQSRRRGRPNGALSKGRWQPV
jgi:hypothetical protein